jgi:ribonuclease G
MHTDIYINAASNESRIAIVEDDRLAEIWVERPENQRMVGDIYKGTVTAVLPVCKRPLSRSARSEQLFCKFAI